MRPWLGQCVNDLDNLGDGRVKTGRFNPGFVRVTNT